MNTPQSTVVSEPPTRTRRLTRILAGAAAALVAAAGIVAVALPATATPGHTGALGGSVEMLVEGNFSVPADDQEVEVTAYLLDEDGRGASTEPEWTTYTAGDGSFSFGELPVGDWVFSASYRGGGEAADGEYHAYVTQFLNADGWLSGSTIEEVVWNEASYGDVFAWIGEGETPSLDFLLVWGGVVRGQVTSTSNAPLAGQPVQLWRHAGTDVDMAGTPEWSLDTQTTTGVDGSYEFVGLPDGQYTLRAGGAGGYAAQYFDAQQVGSVDDADWFFVQQGMSPVDVRVADFELVKAGTVSGTVKDSSGKALAGIVVTPYYDDWGYWVPWEGAAATTNSKGAYSLTLPAGIDFRVGFASAPGSTAVYTEQFWPKQSDLDDATPITLAAGKSKTGVNATLARAGVISGTVSLAGGGHPTAVWIYACLIESWMANPCELSDYVYSEGETTYDPVTGAYSISPLPAGKYMVVVRYHGEGNFQNEWWNDAHSAADATAITLAKGASVTGRDFVLDPGASVTGTVRLDGQGIGARISAYPVGVPLDTQEFQVKNVYADEDGHYTLTGLTAGRYYLRAEDTDTTTSWEFYGGGYREQDAVAITVSGTGTVTGIDFDLDLGATISGSVLGQGGEPVDARVQLEKLGSVGTAVVGSDYSWGEDFEFERLTPGRYLVRAVQEGGSVLEGHLESYYGAPGSVDPTQATVIEVAAGEEIDIDLLMPLGGAYTGRLVDSAGDPVPYAWITATNSTGYGTDTDGNGEFSIGSLLPGLHELSISGPEGFVEEMIIVAPATTTDAEPVDLGEIVLERESVISGVVVGTNGKGVGNVGVYAYMRNGTGLTDVGLYDYTDKGGNFQVRGLPDGQVYLYFSPGDEKSPYPEQFLGGGDDWTFSEPVELTAPGSVAFREVRLLTGGTIKGTVKSAQTGRVVSGVGVWATATAGTSWGYGYGMTNSKGAYSIPGLTAGGYEVQFNTHGTGNGTAYGVQNAKVYVPDRTTVTANASLAQGQTVAGVVRDADGAPLSGIEVDAFPVGGGDGYTAVTSALGAYSFKLLPGQWKLQFSDPQGRVASLFYGGTAGIDAATAIVVGTKAISGRDIVLPAATGGIDVTRIVGSEDDEPDGTIWVQRIEDDEVVSSVQVLRSTWYYPLWKQFPVRGLADGTYRLVIDAESSGGRYGGSYARYTSDDIVVAGGLVTVVPEIDLGTAVLNPIEWEYPVPIQGDEPVIAHDGSPQVGEGISLINGSWNVDTADYYGQFFIQWLRDGKVIPGATAEIYALTPGDAGKQITAYIGMVPYGGYGYGGFGVYVDLDEPVAKASAPTTVDDPLISGKGAVGQKLTADPGVWDTSGLTFTYQWTRDGEPIAKATAKTYTLATADVDAIIAVEVTATRTGFEDGLATASLDAPVVPKVALKQNKASKVSTLGDGWLVTTGTWSQKGVTLVYEWREYDADGADYTVVGIDSGVLSDAEVFAGDTKVTVALTGSKAGYTSTTVEVPVRLGPVPAVDGDPVITGTPQVGYELGVDFDGVDVTPLTATVSYQWLKNGKAIKGATKATYTPVPGDAGATISVRVTLKAAGYKAPAAPQVEIASAVPVAAGAAFASSTPWISGTPAVGRGLTAQLADWSPMPTKVTYQWLRDGVAIKKATKASYTPVAADAGRTITVRITASRPGYATTTLVTHPDDAVVIENLAPQMVDRPVITGTPAVGSKLRVSTGTWDIKPTSFRYQWVLNGEEIPGATSSTYTPTVSDLGEELLVLVTAVRKGFPDSDAVDSDGVTVVEGVALTASKAPALTVGGKTVKSVKAGQTITTTAGTWPVAALSLHYQWQIDRGDGDGWVDLDGQTAKTLYLDIDEYAGVTDAYQFRVEVTGSRTGYRTGAPAYSKALPLKG